MDKKRKKSKSFDDYETEVKSQKHSGLNEHENRFELPTEILLQIFSLLSVKDLCKAARLQILNIVIYYFL